jgi:putative tricarboxylic transport membrane protein
MLQGLTELGQQLLGFLTIRYIFDILWSTQLGIIVGMLPGLTATMGVALMTTLTYKFNTDHAVLILICMYIGAIFGGSRTAILINIPGTPANAATTVDGNPLARQGRAGEAMGIATTGSFLGSLFGMMMLAVFTPIIGNAALNFYSFEYFWLTIFGIIICGTLTAPKDPLKGWIAGFFGLFVATIGMEGMHAYRRFTFGNVDLGGGIALLPAMIGVFGFSEVLMTMKQPAIKIVSRKIEKVIPYPREILKYWRTIIRSGFIGTVIGAIPGVGEDIGAWVSYDFAKKASKQPEKYGKGSIEGLLAAETGNNAAVAGAIIPVLSLAIPGSAPAAVLLGAMIIHGIRPGPLLMIEHPDFVIQVVAMFFLATCAMFILGLMLIRVFIKILLIPRQRLMPVIFSLCVIGAYALSSRIFDIWIMAVFGLIGYAMKEMDYPVAPAVLGIILGDLLDKNLRRSLILTKGNIIPLFTRPISFILVLLIVFTIVSRTKWFEQTTSFLKNRLRLFLRGRIH